MNDSALQSRLDWHLERHLELAATNARLDDELGTHHGLAWSDFVLLWVLDGADGAVPSAELARRLGLAPSRLVLQLLPLEKTGLVVREANVDGRRRVTLRPSGRRLLREARETAAFVCAEAYRLRDAASLR
ncbi:MarR family transcriptional regulator [Ramlibacter sp. G-1-2-2]|uniref:MarR family transcriptional regulator n=1 Tax=Ramlibacter agri TaxID=2728837 RepID=A0A848H6E1_9BURK|nr:MarR family transcriptional regulator [Ramlibacter agri]NML44870.1 MarR family transcriptional regulator [Ramlibacter agri]